MKVKQETRGNKKYAVLTPVPNKDTKHALTIVHSDYDIHLNIKEGKDEYKLSNPDSIKDMWISGKHGRNSQLFTEEDLEQMQEERNNDVSVSELAEKYNVSKSFIHTNIDDKYIPANEIRLKYQTGNYTQKELADEYGIGQSQLSRIVRKKLSTV